MQRGPAPTTGRAKDLRREEGQMMPLVAAVLLFARGHRRRQDELWGGTPAADVPSLSLARLDGATS